MTTLAISKTVNTLRLIVMPLGKLTIACRIEKVYKVVNQPQIYSSGLGYTGFTQVDGQEITVIDLHRKLFQVSASQGYLVVLTPDVGDLIALLVENPPSLIDVPCDSLRVLPESYRQSDTLSIASHVTIVPEGEKTLTIFLLDETSL